MAGILNLCWQLLKPKDMNIFSRSNIIVAFSIRLAACCSLAPGKLSICSSGQLSTGNLATLSPIMINVFFRVRLQSANLFSCDFMSGRVCHCVILCCMLLITWLLFPDVRLVERCYHWRAKISKCFIFLPPCRNCHRGIFSVFSLNAQSYIFHSV